MKDIRNQTDYLIDELINLRDSRKSIDDFNFNFLNNFYEYCSFMHMHLSKAKELKKYFIVAYRQYFVFLISCWETFFRDLFVYVFTTDKASIEILLLKMKNKDNDIKLKNITLPELLSKSFNFQDIRDLENAFNDLWGSNFLEYVCETKIDYCGLNGKTTKGFSIVSLIPDWHNLIIKSFDIRHKVVHDANYRVKIDVHFIQKVEVIFLFIPQLVTYFVAKRFGLKQIVLSNGELTVPYIFSIQEILSDDWVVVSN